MSQRFLAAGLGCLVFCTLGLAQSASPEPRAVPALERALQLARAHRYTEAAAAIRGTQPPQAREQRIAFFRLRAAIESGLGHSSRAAADMESAARLAPENVDLQVGAGLARLEAQLRAHADPAPALEALRAIELAPDRQLDLRLRSAESLSRANLYAEAAKEFAAASRLAPGRADVLFNLALAHYRDRDWKPALSAAERAQALEDSGAVESLLGDIQEKLGDPLAAARSYQAAVTLEPKVEEHRLALAMELLKHQTFDAAIVVLEQAAGLFPQSQRIKVLLGLTYYLVDRSPDSVQTLLAATRLPPKDEIATRYLGEITLQDASAPDPAAVRQICAFADAHPASTSANAFCGGVWLRLAQESGDTSRQQEILRRLREAVRIAPRDPLPRCQLGKALEWSQQWQQARLQLEKCAQLDPDSPEGHYRLARVYRRLGLTSLASQQTTLQQQAARRQSEESTRRANTVTRFLVLLEH